LVIAKPGSGSDLPYPDIAVGDVIIASWGGKLVESNPVTQAQIDDPLNNPIIVHISKAVILAAGDSGSDKLAVSFLVRDFADNDSEDWCKEARIRVDTGNSRLDAPILKQADGNELDLDQLGNEQLVLQVFAASSVDFNLGDIIIMHLQGTTLDGEPVEVEVRQRIDKNPPLVVDVLMDNDGARALAKTQGVFFFDLERGGSIIQRSRGRFINMKGEPKRLAAPIIESAVGGALDPDLANVIVRIPYDPLITPDNAIELIWSITLADGTVFEPELDWIFPTEDEADDPNGFITIISGPKYLKPGEGGTLVVSYNVLSEDQNGEIVRRPSTPAAQLNIGEPRFELVPPILLGEKDGALEPKDLPNGISEVNCPNPVNNPTKAKDVVHWQLHDASGKVLFEDNKTLNTLSAGKDVKFPLNAAFVQQYFEAHRGERLSVRYHIERFDTGKISYSNPLEFRVGAALELPAPDIKEAPNGISLDPLAAKDSLTAIINYPMQAGDKLTVTWTGAPGTPAEGSHTTTLINAGTQPQPIPLLNSVVAFNLNKTVTVTYTVTRGGVALPPSPALTLSVLALPVSALPKPRIPQAANNGEGPELNLGNFTSIALRMDSYPFMAVGQFWWLRMRGTNANGSVFDTVYWKAPTAVVTQSLINNGFYEGPIAASSLMGLRDGSPLTMEFKAALGKSQNEAEAVTFPLRTYTVRTVALVAPVISGVKDASGWDIPDNGYSVRDSVTISGTAPAGQQVEIFDGNVSKGKVTATGGTWSITLNGLALNVLHSITAVGQYGSNPRSNVWRFTSVQGQVPAITRVNDSKGTAIANGGSTSDSTITLTGTANALLRVEIFDNGVSTGKTVAANAQGVWELVLTGLGIATHAFTAKALYGSGTTSNAWTIKLTPSFSIDTRQMELNGLAVKINWPTTGRDFIGNTEIRTPTGGVGTLSYTSSNTSVASVASNGKVTGQRNGTATITVRDASQSAVSYNVRVSNIFRLEHSAAIGQPGMNADQAFNWLNAVAGSIPLTSALPAMYEVYGSFLYWPGYPSDCIYWMCDASGCSGNSILWFVFARGGLQCHPNRYESKLAWCLRPL
ncbi:Ig-like domain-containing protein, partial [Pseudomonas sp. HMWF021]|uniref:Ig-like domain-containing protein n=1 Tax=Pseudomonas sp. HMWF021 TaxID=2056857 RepID=UPI000D456B8F